MKVALVGLMQSGKSTVLSAISGKKPAAVGAPHVEEAIVSVPDQRLEWLEALYKPKRTVMATLDCLDFPGFNFTDNSGRSAAKRLIDEVRTVDMFVLVVRAFEDDSIPAYRGSIDPARDLNELQSEFLLSDLELVTTRIERLEEQLKKRPKTYERDKAELALQLKLQQALEAEKPAATAIDTEEEIELIKSLGLYTLRPMCVVLNVGEDNLQQSFDLSQVLDESIPTVSLCAKIEQELSQLDQESRKEFMEDLGIAQPAANKFINSCYTALGLISFLTVGSDEVRAWPISSGISALDAAGKVHTDIKRGFIRAETMAYEDLRELGTEKAMKAAGKTRLEGKTYVVQDGDIINYRFNV